jgi:hypothetical protein
MLEKDILGNNIGVLEDSWSACQERSKSSVIEDKGSNAHHELRKSSAESKQG